MTERVASSSTQSPTDRQATGCQARTNRLRTAVIALLCSSGPSATDVQTTAERGPGAGPHEYTADNIDLGAMVEQLSASRESPGQIAELTDSQLDAIPPKDSFKFCDGQRTVEQVLASLLKHQDHQADALKKAIPSQPGAA
jgi:hypothetical protein